MLELLTRIQNTHWLYAVFIFVARVADVSLGTLHSITIFHKTTLRASWLGFATRNLIGIKVEKFIAIGHLILRAISRTHPTEIAQKVRRQGYRVTTFTGEGKSALVAEL